VNLGFGGEVCGFRVWGQGLKDWGLGFWIQDNGFKI
jgi:hypothetical protein